MSEHVLASYYSASAWICSTYAALLFKYTTPPPDFPTQYNSALDALALIIIIISPGILYLYGDL